MSSDYIRLLETVGVDEELARELIGIFIHECPGMLAQIQQAIRENQPERLHNAAHTLKGPLSNMGANAALDQVVALETMGINGDLQQADTALQRLSSHLDILIRDLMKKAGRSVV